MATIWNNLQPKPEAEPRTVPETQRWLSRKGFPECTENDARHALYMRLRYRTGALHDDKVDSDG